MMKINNPKLILSGFLVLANVSLIIFLLLNIINTNKNENLIQSLSKAENVNKKYFTKLNQIFEGINKGDQNNLNQFSDDYVFDSSIEAITNRELFQKHGFPIADYKIVKELESFKTTSIGNLGYIQLGYSLSELKFEQVLKILNIIDENDRYDYINELRILKSRGTKGDLSVSFTYTNFGLILE
ncbi:MAG: hypothetical protein QF852_07560 [Candidatus Marinimicrobia bacterium]|nr:hypothetical protein [Candidatus Neomarinimicrobiota bacterium]